MNPRTFNICMVILTCNIPFMIFILVFGRVITGVPMTAEAAQLLEKIFIANMALVAGGLMVNKGK